MDGEWPWLPRTLMRHGDRRTYNNVLSRRLPTGRAAEGARPSTYNGESAGGFTKPGRGHCRGRGEHFCALLGSTVFYSALPRHHPRLHIEPSRDVDGTDQNPASRRDDYRDDDTAVRSSAGDFVAPRTSGKNLGSGAGCGREIVGCAQGYGRSA